MINPKENKLNECGEVKMANNERMGSSLIELKGAIDFLCEMTRKIKDGDDPCSTRVPSEKIPSNAPSIAEIMNAGPDQILMAANEIRKQCEILNEVFY